LLLETIVGPDDFLKTINFNNFAADITDAFKHCQSILLIFIIINMFSSMLKKLSDSFAVRR
jgi:hypothetical protein